MTASSPRRVGAIGPKKAGPCADSLSRESSTYRAGVECGCWETRFGSCAALSLSVLEVKRLLLLTLEMLLDSRAIRFAGALVPVVFSFVDVGLGFPVAIATVYTLRRYRVLRSNYPRRGLRRVALVLLICAILNVTTLLLMGYRVDLKNDSLRDLFFASMQFYATRASCKLTLDELQLDLECCGASNFADWFYVDWQGMEYVDSEDKQYDGERSVPFSCCKRRTLLPCVHTEMRKENLKTINSRGCAVALGALLFKIIVIGYSMTGLILLTQIIIIILLIRIINKILPDICPSDCSCCESACLISEANISYSSSDGCSPCPAKLKQSRAMKSPKPQKKRGRRFWQRPRRFGRKSTDTSRCCTATSSWSSDSSARLTSSPGCEPLRIGHTTAAAAQTARISPSTHLQHQVAEKCKQRT